jgi:site-specific DNA-cytosine methylase
MKILSLFDGMACGMIAMLNAGIEVESYDAYEIDKYAIQTVPEWYDFSVISNSQAYKCLGNGWTCDVITHLINSALLAGRKKWLDDLLGDCL